MNLRRNDTWANRLGRFSITIDTVQFPLCNGKRKKDKMVILHQLSINFFDIDLMAGFLSFSPY